MYRTLKIGSQIFTSPGDGGAKTLVVTHAVGVGGGVGRLFADLLGSSVWGWGTDEHLELWPIK